MRGNYLNLRKELKKYGIDNNKIIKYFFHKNKRWDLIYENNKITKKRYWNTLDHIKLNNLSYSEQLESWKYLFLDSVKIRMRADVPIGYTLSGGLDSSSIVAAASQISQKNNDERISNDNINLFNSSFPNSFNDESKYAKKS